MRRFIFLSICSILLFSIILGLLGCSRGTIKSWQGIEQRIKDYLTLLYTVPDYNLYDEFLDSDIAEQNFDKAYDELHEKFKPYLREESYKGLLTGRRYSSMLYENFRGKYTSKLNRAVVEKTSEYKEQGLIVYRYEAEVINTYADTNEQYTIIRKGKIQAYDENGQWRFAQAPYGRY